MDGMGEVTWSSFLVGGKVGKISLLLSVNLGKHSLRPLWITLDFLWVFVDHLLIHWLMCNNLIEPIDIHTWKLWVKLIHHGNNLPKVCPTVHGKNPADHRMDTVQLHNTTSCTVWRWLYTQIIMWQGDWIPRDRFETKNTIDSRHQNHGATTLFWYVNVICAYHIHLLEVEPAGSKKDVLKYNIGYSIQLYSTPQIVNIFCLSPHRTMPNPRLVP